MAVLITGGAGFIGSHTCLRFLEAGEDVVVLDNFSNAVPVSLARVAQITGRSVGLVEGDVRDTSLVAKTLTAHHCTSVIHLAGSKAVQESIDQPIEYYENNFMGTLSVLKAMAQAGTRQLIYSSSATVYGAPQVLPLPETHRLDPINPYGRSKEMAERLLLDVCASNPDLTVALLRYFNPVGAHESGMIGENPQGVPSNLMPLLSQVVAGSRPHVEVYGADYDTPDGTGVRDYIHVMDLAQAHLRAFETFRFGGCVPLNLGTGQGYSVMQMIQAYSKASGCDIPYRVVERRAGDVAQCYADPSKALSTMGWRADKGLEQMCADAWTWVQKNPNGYVA